MDSQNQSIIQQQLYELDKLYHTAPLAIYETALQAAITQIERAFPGFTIAYAEIYAAGSQREAHGGMRHVLLPLPAHDPSPGPDVQSVSGIYSYTMVTLPAAWPTAQRHGPRKRVVQDKAPPPC